MIIASSSLMITKYPNGNVRRVEKFVEYKLIGKLELSLEAGSRCLDEGTGSD